MTVANIICHRNVEGYLAPAALLQSPTSRQDPLPMTGRQDHGSASHSRVRVSRAISWLLSKYATVVYCWWLLLCIGHWDDIQYSWKKQHFTLYFIVYNQNYLISGWNSRYHCISAVIWNRCHNSLTSTTSIREYFQNEMIVLDWIMTYECSVDRDAVLAIVCTT